MTQVLGVLLPVFLIILVGHLYGRWQTSEISTINRLNIDVFLPALVIDALAKGDFDVFSYKWLVLGGLILILLSGVVAWLVALRLKYSIPAFVPTMMFNNSGNMGLPIAVLAFSESALPAAMVLFLVSNTLHFTLGTYIVGGRISWLKLLSLPINIATVIGLSLNFANIQLIETIALPIQMLGQVAIPVMLFTLGIRMIDIDFHAWKIGVVGAIVCPLSGLIPAIFLIWILPLDLIQQQQLLLFSIFPPAVMNYILAERYQQQPGNVASMVVIGNASSLITIFLMLLYLKQAA
ncbi:AEC family transporter [Leucothrix arctica]|uniref:Transporter n=1 Tax=Leucothrix arctica TaxID=1481894 RepID=A0A317CIA0_9GAMM|nr:AEC family transporter [Leucothrix arctica]PWQ97997.1 transporter [Leucothrix arctica]